MSRAIGRVGVPGEVKPDERRVGLTPAGARELVALGVPVTVERGAGAGSGFADEQYARAGARIAAANEVWESAELIVKVKEPQPAEFAFLREGLTLFTYLHLAAERELVERLLAARVTAIAYETVEDARGRLPLLAPMSEIAGRVTAQLAACLLYSSQRGKGMLLGGLPGVAPGTVVVVGGGIAGYSAARIAVGLGARVRILDRDGDRLRELESAFGGAVELVASTEEAVEESCREADVVIGAVLIPGARAPSVVSRAMVAGMRKGSIVCDISIDQGGCVETARPTTHSDPTYLVDGVLHECISNLPAAVPMTSTRSLTNATLPHVRVLADRGVPGAVQADPGLLRGLSTVAGELCVEPVAAELGLPFVAPETAVQAALH